MKGKVGEALAAGLPLVTTTIGAQGMSLISGQDCLIADRPAEFASDVIRLLSDSEVWRKLSKNGRKFMQDNFELAEIRKALLSFFDNINGNPV
jgi:glycosyltransferase involved in cell wall biosynthesis